MIKLRSPAAHAVSVVEPVNPAALWIVQGETVLDSLGSACRSLDPLRRYLDPMPAGKLKLQAVKAQQHLEFVIHLGHESSYQDLIA